MSDSKSLIQDVAGGERMPFEVFALKMAKDMPALQALEPDKPAATEPRAVTSLRSRLRHAQRRLTYLDQLDDAEWQRQGDIAYDREKKHELERLSYDSRRKRVEEMLEAAREWEVSGADLEALKRHMVAQLLEVLQKDLVIPPHLLRNVVHESGQQRKERMIAATRLDIELVISELTRLENYSARRAAFLESLRASASTLPHRELWA